MPSVWSSCRKTPGRSPPANDCLPRPVVLPLSASSGARDPPGDLFHPAPHRLSPFQQLFHPPFSPPRFAGGESRCFLNTCPYPIGFLGGGAKRPVCQWQERPSGRRELNESTETSGGSGSEPPRRLRLRKEGTILWPPKNGFPGTSPPHKESDRAWRSFPRSRACRGRGGGRC